MIYRIETKQKHENLKEFEEHLSEIENNVANITHLDLSGNTFSRTIATEIVKKIKKMKKLKKIKMEAIMESLNPKKASEVWDILFGSFPLTLEELEMSRNELAGGYPASIGNFLGACPLRVLNLYNCSLGNDGLARLCNDLSMLENKRNLEVLNLGRNGITRLEESFTDIFNEFVNLYDFRIRSNGMEEESLNHFIKNWKCDNLKILDLCANSVSIECPSALGKLFNRSKLEELYLSDTEMDNDDLYEFLSIALKKSFEELPGGLLKEKPSLILDISSIEFEQNCADLLEKLTEIYNFKKLVIHKKPYASFEKLIDLVFKSDGVVVIKEYDLIYESSILAERIKNI